MFVFIGKAIPRSFAFARERQVDITVLCPGDLVIPG